MIEEESVVGRAAARWAAALACAAAAGSLLISWRTLGLVSHVSDEIAYTFQARIFAGGHLALTPPDPAAAFTVQHIIAQPGMWLSMYPPGWPLLLVPGIWIGAPWLVSPLLLALSVLGVFTLARELHDDRTGLLAAALFAASPFVLLHGAGRMAHLPTLCLSMWCAVFLRRAGEAPVERRGNRLLAAGALGGAAWLVRQVSATALLAVPTAYALRRVSGSRARFGAFARLAAGAAPFVVGALAFNATVFGSPFLSGYRVHDPTLRFNGYGGDYTPYTTLFGNTLPRYAADLCRSAWGFPWPDLLVLAPLLRPGTGRSKDALLAASAGALVVTFSCYWFYDVIYGGPRLVFEAMGFLAILAARGLREAASWIRPLAERLPKRILRPATAVAVAALVLWPIAARLPGQLRYHAMAYQGAVAGLASSADAAGVGPDALVLYFGPSYAYGTLFEANALPPAAGRRVFVRDVPELRPRLLEAYPRPEVWQVELQLDARPGPNDYEDAFEVTSLRWHRVH